LTVGEIDENDGDGEQLARDPAAAAAAGGGGGGGGGDDAGDGRGLGSAALLGTRKQGARWVARCI
jgi:hypothetical protein